MRNYAPFLPSFLPSSPSKCVTPPPLTLTPERQWSLLIFSCCPCPPFISTFEGYNSGCVSDVPWFYSADTLAVCTVVRWAEWTEQKQEVPLTQWTLEYASVFIRGLSTLVVYSECFHSQKIILQNVVCNFLKLGDGHIQRWDFIFADLVKQDPGRARQNS